MPHLPVARGAAASGIAAAKTAKTAVARIGPAESAAAAAAPGGAAHQVTQNQGGQNTAAAESAEAARRSGANQPEEQADSTEDHRPGDGIGGAGPVAPGQAGGKGQVLGLPDGVANGFGGRQHGVAIIALRSEEHT